VPRYEIWYQVRDRSIPGSTRQIRDTVEAKNPLAAREEFGRRHSKKFELFYCDCQIPLTTFNKRIAPFGQF